MQRANPAHIGLDLGYLFWALDSWSNCYVILGRAYILKGPAQPNLTYFSHRVYLFCKWPRPMD